MTFIDLLIILASASICLAPILKLSLRIITPTHEVSSAWGDVVAVLILSSAIIIALFVALSMR